MHETEGEHKGFPFVTAQPLSNLTAVSSPVTLSSAMNGRMTLFVPQGGKETVFALLKEANRGCQGWCGW